MMHSPVAPIASAKQPRLRLSPNTLHRPINLALFIVGCGLAGTGWLLDQRLPHGPYSRGLDILGYTRHQWGTLHTWLGYTLIALVGLHLVLHATWLRRIAAGKHPWRLVAGLAAGAAVIVFFMIVPIRR